MSTALPKEPVPPEMRSFFPLNIIIPENEAGSPGINETSRPKNQFVLLLSVAITDRYSSINALENKKAARSNACYVHAATILCILSNEPSPSVVSKIQCSPPLATDWLLLAGQSLFVVD
ncbi:hypothetical protein [Pseudomonas serbiensis]|uniref:hypothetical protein n=1 Tax=Pseudomonas serbiensis TaxID=3064350 RepID=UPI00272AA9B5|nr:hypothetical protein [Pseudomonas sp. KFB-138]